MTLQDGENAIAGRTICIADDRSTLEPAIRLLIASLAHEWPGQRIDLFFTPEGESFAGWVRKFPQVVFHRERIPGDYGKYDVKPHAFLQLFNMGAEDVVWIDSDILVASGVAAVFERLNVDTVVLTEEALGDFHGDKDGLRARLWNMPVGRVLPFCLNTGVLRLTTRHRALVERWRDCLQSDAYVAAQSAPWSERPVHFLGDQDVLTALLASRDFADLPLRILRRGSDVLQFFGVHGYTLGERLRHLVSGPPAFVHSMGHKPWWTHETQPEGSYEQFVRLYRELSPYTLLARKYRDELVASDWLEPRSSAGRLLARAAFGSLALHGAPLAAVADLKRAAGLARKALRR